ncbi:MAG: hypothetical protein LBR97_09705 [Dysgonamonadaceae bacterium]|jgi:hypothetical protein|nr:hypothetical protein [Dysgonamonadaceae bacterium]
MDNLSEYIPLLIIIASVIISIVRKSKQPARKVDMPEDLFELEEPQPYFVPEAPVPEQEPATPVVRKIPAFTKKEPANYKKVVETPEVDEYENISIDLSNPDEMKKAIIYSEIFNKKDF